MLPVPPVLLACSHGTRSAQGASAVEALVAAVRAARPGLEVVLAHIDVQAPTPDTVVAGLGERPVVIVPLLLTAGYHVHVDLARAAASSPRAWVTPALAPDARVTAALAAHLTAFAPSPDDELVVVSAGSSDSRARRDCAQVSADLARRLAVVGTAAYVSAGIPNVGSAVAAARARLRARPHPGRVLVGLNLLAPGHFASLAREQALSSGADAVGPALLTAPSVAQEHDSAVHLGEVHADVVRLLTQVVLDRYEEGVQAVG